MNEGRKGGVEREQPGGRRTAVVLGADGVVDPVAIMVEPSDHLVDIGHVTAATDQQHTRAGASRPFDTLLEQLLGLLGGEREDPRVGEGDGGEEGGMKEGGGGEGSGEARGAGEWEDVAPEEVVRWDEDGEPEDQLRGRSGGAVSLRGAAERRQRAGRGWQRQREKSARVRTTGTR